MEDIYLSGELTEAEQRALRRLVSAGSVHRIYPGIFSPLPESEWPALLRHHRIRVLAAQFPDAVLGFRTAFEGSFTGPEVFLSYSYNREVDLPGVKIHLVKGTGPQTGDLAMNGRKLYFPSESRFLLDNLAIDRSGKDRNVSRAKLEERLIEICQSRGEESLNALRDRARDLAPALNRQREFAILDNLIGAVLTTRPDYPMQSIAGQSRAKACDEKRLHLFDELVNRLRNLDYRRINDRVSTYEQRQNFAFLESYFSNFIEGTEFEVSEAREIALHGMIVKDRPKDSHDIIGVFELARHPGWRTSTLPHTDAVITHLRERHEAMMKNRPEAGPGEFKIKPNVAGNTRFVEPPLVRGTLVEAAKRLPEVPPGLPRALLAMFIIAEVHPFIDGNGRLARLMMNAELSHAGETRIIIPTLIREDYLDCLRLLTREGNPDGFLKVMREAQVWSDSFNYSDLDQVIGEMGRCNAFEKSRIQYQLYAPNGTLFGRLTSESSEDPVKIDTDDETEKPH